MVEIAICVLKGQCLCHGLQKDIIRERRLLILKKYKGKKINWLRCKMFFRGWGYNMQFFGLNSAFGMGSNFQLVHIIRGNGFLILQIYIKDRIVEIARYFS